MLIGFERIYIVFCWSVRDRRPIDAKASPKGLIVWVIGNVTHFSRLIYKTIKQYTYV